MNAKRCKALRRLAERETVGRPARQLVWAGTHAINHADTTRGHYRALKKMVHKITFTKVAK